MITETPNKPISTKVDYSLTGINAKKAIDLGLAEAVWYQTPVPRQLMRDLLIRKDGPAIRDTILLFLILACTAWFTVILWGSWWAALPYLIYAVFYGTSSDSRWHECGHGTAFRTDWLNNVLYEVSSFMVMRESTVWRWSHIRHHSDTIIIGRDPEIQIPRPPDVKAMILSLFNLAGYKAYFTGLLLHSLGKITAEEKTFIPEDEYPAVFSRARICLGIYLMIIASALLFKSWIPVFLFILPQFFGTWLMIVHNTTQHAGLAENVLDHRLNCRTVYMNPISRFIYWNMNYHTEHHMFPLVPYHALPRLHQLIKNDCAPVYPSIYAAWREILPALLKQQKDPGYYIKRKLPASQPSADRSTTKIEVVPDLMGWINIGPAEQLKKEDVIRFDNGNKTYAIYRDVNGLAFATDGICTHGNTHLSEGLVKGTIVECPKHNGRFNLRDGSPARAPICRGLATYLIEERLGNLWLNVNNTALNEILTEKNFQLRVVSNQNVSTFIKELVLEPANNSGVLKFTPGDYLQIKIPAYEEIKFGDMDIAEPYHQVWKRQNLFDLCSTNTASHSKNNYSMASNALKDDKLRFNVRIATPPVGQECPPGIGSSYIFNLKPNDILTATGPYGDFHIKPTAKEMIYIGGGAGMAPIRAHIAHLLENECSKRKISYWYGARSRQEIFYADYFNGLAADHNNFLFNIALSEPLESDNWDGFKGFIHEVVWENYLKTHKAIHNVEFYLCGPPMMITACSKLLFSAGVTPNQLSFDEF